MKDCHIRVLKNSIENPDFNVLGEIKFIKESTSGNQVIMVYGQGYARTTGDLKFLVDGSWVNRTTLGSLTLSPDAGDIIIEDKYALTSINADYYNTKMSIPAEQLEFMGNGNCVVSRCGIYGNLTGNLQYLNGPTNLLYFTDCYGQLTDEDYERLGDTVISLDMGRYDGEQFIVKKLFESSSNRVERLIIGRNNDVVGNLEELYEAPVLRYIAVDKTSTFKFSWPSATLRSSELPIIRVDYAPMFESITDVDNYLINMSNCVVSTTGAINIGGPGRTAISDSAIATLKSEGYSITINNVPQ